MSSMAAYSNANNFAVENRVDNRTGQYGLSIEIPQLVGNGGTGPNLTLTLAYNSMGASDVGYGDGWDLNLSRFVEHAYPEGGGALSLSTGEQFTVDGIDSISEKKLDTFHFHKDGDGRFRIVHRTGVVEILETMGAGAQRAALPTRIYSASGQWIELSYASNPVTPGWFCLTEVRDGHPDGPGKGRLLLQATHGGTTTFTRYPDAEDVRASHVLKFNGRQLQNVVAPDQSQWAFEYRPVHEQTCVTKVVWPTGAVEHVEYGVDGDPGHGLPGVDKKLPRVKRHRLQPGRGQPEMRTDYDYSPENFMGNGRSITWRNSGRDNLFDVVKSDYRYWCSTTQRCTGQDDLITTTYYDRFHRTSTQTRRQGKAVTRTEMDYHGDLGDPFSRQPPTYLMPKATTTHWEMVDDANKKRRQTVFTDYDAGGNLLREVREDGTSTVLEYFDAKGEAGRCPAEPNGFKKHVKSKTVYPSTLDRIVQGAAPLRTDFTYTALEIVQGRVDVPEHGKVASTWLAIQQEELFDATDAQAPRHLHTVNRSYLGSPANARLHGRLAKLQTTLLGEHDGTRLGKVLASTSTTVEWKFSHNVHRALGDVLQTTQTTTGHNLGQKVTKQSQHALTGQILENIDIHNTVKRFSYDTSNRLTQEVSAPDDAQRRASLQYRYVVSAEHNYRETEDNLGVISRDVLDGVNRTIRRETTCEDVAANTRQRQTYLVYSAQYNAFGQLEEETTFDHLRGIQQASTSQHRYDNWGNRYATLRPDQVTVFDERSPFGAEGDIVTSWVEYPDQPGVRKNQRVTTFNGLDKPEQVQTLGETGEVESIRAYRYDGLGRAVEETFTFGVPASGKRTARAEHKRTIGYRYDVWGRMVRNDRADASALSREFAHHSTDELATRTLLHPQSTAEGLSVCEREFDDLDRMVSMTVGPHRETHMYLDAQMVPEQRVMRSGRTFNYEYDLAVGTAPTQITAGKNQKPSKFKYSMASADITEAENEQGKRNYDYTDQGYLLSESWADQHSGKKYKRDFLTSLQGRPLESRESDDGTENNRKVYDFDALGRLCTLSQGTLQSVFTYNSAGLLHTTLTTNSADATRTQQLLCTQAYDHRGRETSRTLTLSRLDSLIDERTLQQVWRDDNLLHSRTLSKAGAPVLTESFEYDDRDRLFNHRCEGSVLPSNSKGRAITNQAFEFDAYDNIQLCITTFADGEEDVAEFEYFADAPFQLQRVSHSLSADYPELISFTKDDYDADGNMLKDDQGNRLEYDEDSGLLSRVTTQAGKELATYRYDGHGQLLAVSYAGQPEELRRYEGYRVSSTLCDGMLTEYLYGGEVPLGLQRSGKGSETRLYMASHNNSVLAECAANGEVHEANYSAYGEVEDGKLLGLLGFNAEAREQALGWYLLGRGYRAYNPSLMRFHSPDNMAPEVAGINPYAYCLGNPVMWQDPTGHYSSSDWGSNDDPKTKQEKRGFEFWLNIGVVVMNTALTIGFAIATGGAAAPLVKVVLFMGITSTLASVATQVSSEFVKDPDKKKKMSIAYLSLSLIGSATLAAGMIKGRKDIAARKKTDNSQVINNNENHNRRDSTGSMNGNRRDQFEDLAPESNFSFDANGFHKNSRRRSDFREDNPVFVDDPDYSSSSSRSSIIQENAVAVDAENKPLPPNDARLFNNTGNHVVSGHGNKIYSNYFKSPEEARAFASTLGRQK